MAETETLTVFLEKRPRRDIGTSRDRDVETETTTLSFTHLGEQERIVTRHGTQHNIISV